MSNLTPLGAVCKRLYLLLPVFVLTYPFLFVYTGFILARKELRFVKEFKFLWKEQFNNDEQ